MELTDNKYGRKRKGEKRDLFCSWEVGEDNEFSDDELYGYQMAKEKDVQKCNYLDERNFILSPNLFATPMSCVPGPIEASDEVNTRWKSQLSIPSKSSDSPEINLTKSAPEHSVPINPSVSTDSMIQKRNIVHSKNSTAVHLVGVSGALPMIEWIPTSSHVHPSEETALQCTKSMNRETRSPQQVYKRASGHELERCHDDSAKVAHLGLSSPVSGLYTARPRLVIRRDARLNAGYRALLEHGGPVEEKLCPLCPYRLPALHNANYSLSTSELQTCKHAVYECFCSSLQPRARHSPVRDQRDATHILEKKEREFSEELREMDIQCQSGCQRNTESPSSPHHVTFSHILQVLQSKPVNFPEVRGHRRHRAL
ncbi:uncharacterized protein [Paramisgurnus dabryanus]|uniref:uncharacterized protein isoform X1 n=1 Tax=Paramisgurnus dabryanus TaxID=90735 RepID=UPI0031F45ED5